MGSGYGNVFKDTVTALVVIAFIAGAVFSLAIFEVVWWLYTHVLISWAGV